jgi:hypothetical protein
VTAYLLKGSDFGGLVLGDQFPSPEESDKFTGFLAAL